MLFKLLDYLCIWKEVSLYISFDKIYLIKWCQLSRAFIWVLSWVSFYKNCVLSDITTLFTMKLGRWKHFCIGWVRICYGLCQINELHILPWLYDLELRAGLSVLHTKFCNIEEIIGREMLSQKWILQNVHAKWCGGSIINIHVTQPTTCEAGTWSML